MNKTIWIYWNKGFDKAPAVVKKCRSLWEDKNPTWDVKLLDDKNLSEFIDPKFGIKGFKKKKISVASYSDILRINLLNTHGGLWVDSTTYCYKPLDMWLDEYITEGCFAFTKQSEINVCSWFLYGYTDNVVIDRMCKRVNKYWKNRDDTDRYFWFHENFNKMLKNNNEVYEAWTKIKKFPAAVIKSEGPHYFCPYGKKLFDTDIDDPKYDISKLDIPLFKLTHKYNKKAFRDMSERCVLDNLLSHRWDKDFINDTV